MKNNIYNVKWKSNKIEQSWFWVLKYAHGKKLEENALNDYHLCL